MLGWFSIYVLRRNVGQVLKLLLSYQLFEEIQYIRRNQEGFIVYRSSQNRLEFEKHCYI